MAGLERWLESIGLGQYAPAFARENIDAHVLRTLTEQDLRELGLSLGHRRVLTEAIERLADGENLTEQTHGMAITGAERRQLTVMFCDLVNSSQLAERLDPEDLRQLIGTYRQRCILPIQALGGYVQKFLGDGVFALFGYPTAVEDEAERSIRAALSIVEETVHLGPEIRQRYGVELQVRVGIATGPVVVGDGEGLSERSAVVGQAPNCAARLQELAGPNAVLIARETRMLAGEGFEYRDLGEQHLKGFEHPVTVYQVLRERSANRFEARGGARTPLVGRERERDLLLGRWRKAVTHEGQVAFITGAAGIGKSRLTATICERAAGASSSMAPAIVAFQCLPLHQNTALYPIARQIERLADIERTEAGGEKSAKLQRWFSEAKIGAEARPFIAELLGLAASPEAASTLGPREKRQLTLASLQDWLGAMAERGPLLVVFEDLQWIDPTSRVLFARLIPWARSRPMLILATLRTEGGARADRERIFEFDPEWLNEPHVTVCPLNELDETESRRLVRGIVRGADLPASLVDTIVGKAGGNPLYIEELSNSAARLLEESDPGDAALSRLITIPMPLMGHLLARLDQLGPARALAQHAAVIGEEFTGSLLAKIWRLPHEPLEEHLETLLQSDLIARAARERAGYVFRHALIRDAAYQSLLRRTRQRIHVRIAAQLEAERNADASITDDLIAAHYAQGGAHLQAIAAWKRAADTALARSAQTEATNLLEKALSSLRELPGSGDTLSLELELTMQLAVALGSTRGYAAPEAERAYLLARDLCDRIGEPPLRFNVEFGLMFTNLVKGDLANADRFAAAMLAHVERYPAQPAVDAYLASGMVQTSLGHFSEARGRLAQGAALTQPEHDEPHFLTHGQNPGVFCRSYLSHVLAFMGLADEARAMVGENLALAKRRAHEPSHLYTYVNALTFAARVHLLLGDRATVDELSTELIDVAHRNSYRYYEMIGTIQQGWAKGPSRASAQQMREGLAKLERTGTGLGTRGFNIQLAEMLVQLGDKDAALAALARAKAPMEAGSRAWDAEIERVQGEILAFTAEPDPDAAERCFRSALAIARRQNAGALELKTVVSYARLIMSGRKGEARGMLEEAMQSCGGMTNTPDFAQAHNLLAELKAARAVV